ncbi:uncharacterized protein A4U43_C08F7720 [Asparagus officinalis]|uniref:uncharacterized protein LOC109819455 n=1 Tax=Asparagus officinalis TaxID=4686 RepID=UPI00098E13C3|nr:uncharacterized protein LOC109819455 [Asparagus officinalis]ONK59560.1 uncharacterized protein A4U43_C08F7720 [Asparagus officinalis]
MIRTWVLRINASAHPQSPPPPPLFFSASMSSSSSKLKRSAMSQPRAVRIAIVGDVHDDWDLEEDSRALHFLQPDLVLFTGDYGNENVELVRSISILDIPKSVILGNHDAWRTHQFSERDKKVDRVQLQLECLGQQHVGYKRLDFPTLQLSVVGGRPFSCGGEALFRPRLLSARYGVNDMEESAKKIYEAALGIPEDHSVVLLAHNGPTGLGSTMSDICGRDWVYGGGDHGDPDLAQALHKLKSSMQISIPLVVFGHMHKALTYGGQRKMIAVGDDGTIYLNGAIVPRVKPEPEIVSSGHNETGTLRAFTLLEIKNGEIEKIAETWVFVDGSRVEVQEESTLFTRSHNGVSVRAS